VGATTVNGRLPGEVIDRIVRQNFARFRHCYENGLRTAPNLTGKITVKFVIEKDGQVSTITNGDTTLTDKDVVACVTGWFSSLSFPQPEGGTVTVTFPITFAPSGT
jgi:hypothetical protein